MKTIRSQGQIPAGINGSNVALGMFDGLHRGHTAVIGRAIGTAKSKGLKSIVLTFPFQAGNTPQHKEAGAKLISSKQAGTILQAMGADFLVELPFSSIRGMGAEEFVLEILKDKLGARHIFCGENYRFAKGGQAGVSDLERIGKQAGMDVTALSLVTASGETVSSTRIREVLSAGDVAAAAMMLGRPYAYDFPLMEGKQQRWDSLSLYQAFPPGYAVPRHGVYAGKVYSGGKDFPAAVSIYPGKESGATIAEAALAGDTGRFSGTVPLVELHEWLRPLQQFAGAAERSGQLMADKEKALKVLGQTR